MTVVANSRPRTPLLHLAALLATALIAGTGASEAGPIEVTVMSRNLYWGADLTPIVTATPPELLARTGQVFGAVVATRPVERLERVADEIAAARPHIVGLQEAVLWRSKSPSQFAGGVPGPATEVEFDFVGSLLSGLRARGLSYRAAAVATGFDAQVPGLFPTGIPGVLPPGVHDIRLTDRDVILVRDDLPAGEFRIVDSGAANFVARYAVPVAGTTITALSNYAFVDVDMAGHRFRAASVHLDPNVPPVQLAQAAELIGLLSGLPFPQIALGDFNSPADGSGTATYANMLAAGFSDAWSESGSGGGFTSRHAADLLNPLPTLDERIDFVFHRGGFRTLDIGVVGDELADRTASGLWPSDHAGVVATLQLVSLPGTGQLLVFGVVALIWSTMRPPRMRPVR